MPADFTSLRNYYEHPVVDAVMAVAHQYPALDEDLLPDVACVALNRLPTRYIRHQVDLAFYLTEKERAENEKLVNEAVGYAFEFVQARGHARAPLRRLALKAARHPSLAFLHRMVGKLTGRVRGNRG